MSRGAAGIVDSPWNHIPYTLFECPFFRKKKLLYNLIKIWKIVSIFSLKGISCAIRILHFPTDHRWSHQFSKARASDTRSTCNAHTVTNTRWKERMSGINCKNELQHRCHRTESLKHWCCQIRPQRLQRCNFQRDPGKFLIFSDTPCVGNLVWWE